MERLQFVLSIVNISFTITLSIMALLKPLRKKVFGIHTVEDGQKCLLRSDMLRLYYRHHQDQAIRQYEYENFIYEYNAYKALGGNSFIDKIYLEIQGWEVLS